MDTAAHIVTELRVRLGAKMRDPQAIERGRAALRTELHASPSCWAWAERLALTLGGHLQQTSQGPRPRLAVVADAGEGCE